MDEVDAVDELGPVDWLVVEFPGSKFNGQIAPVLKDSPVGGYGREVKALLNVLPIDDVFSPTCSDHDVFHFAVTKNRHKMWLYCITLERRDLLLVTRLQIVLDDLLNLFNGCWLPSHINVSPAVPCL